MLLVPTPGYSDEDEYAAYLKAKSAFDAGDYVSAAARFEELVEGTARNPALAVECHKHAGVAFLFIGDKERAERHFSDLLSLTPDYELDPLYYPIEVVDFFISVKSNNRDRLEELRRARAADEVRRKAAEEEHRRAELAKLAKTYYVERTHESRSLLVAVMPLGAGQFQNRHKTKGILLLSSELLLAAAATTSFALHESLRQEASAPIANANDFHRFKQQEQVTRAVNQACLITLGGVLIAGFIDALYHFQPQTLTWRQVDEKDVPKELRRRRGESSTRSTKTQSLSLEINGLGLAGRF